VTETDGIVIEGYEPGPVEVFGRRLKMEYIGMASVFVVIAVLIFGGSPWVRTIEATAGSFFLFLGLKKKNRDHLVCSLLLFGAALLARPAVFEASWALSLLLFGATVFSAERYLEKKPQQVAFLPVILGAWAWLDGLWLLGLFYSAAYILCPRSDRPGATKILGQSVIVGAAVGLIVTAIRFAGPGAPDGYWFGARIAPERWLLLIVATLVVAVLVVIGAYQSRLIVPHKINPLDRAPQDQSTALRSPRTVGPSPDCHVCIGRGGPVFGFDLQAEHRLGPNSPLHLACRVALFLPHVGPRDLGGPPGLRQRHKHIRERAGQVPPLPRSEWIHL
jgi:hypothetical protein